MELLKNLPPLPKIELPKWLSSKMNFFKYSLPKLQIGDLTASIPIIQGGMGIGISLSGLASAVAKAGGIGVIASTGVGLSEPDYFKNEVRANKRALLKELAKARANHNGIIGVNLMVALSDFESSLQICIEAKADIVFLGAGLPIKNIPVKQLREANVKVVPIVSSARTADLIFKYWRSRYQDIPDAVVVEGPLAGGHLGFKPEQIDDPDYKLENLIPQVVKTMSSYEKKSGRHIPVIAAGGIFTGADIHKFFKLGAQGVQMGTRFVATKECDADLKLKESYVNCKKEDIRIIKSPVGLPGRAIYSQFFKNTESETRTFTQCSWKCLKSCQAENARYCIAVALDNARKGNLEKGFAFAGANAYRINKIISVRELMKSLHKESSIALEKNISKFKLEYERVMDKLNSLKEQYTMTAEKTLLHLKQKYDNLLVKGNESIKGEFKELLTRISSLKREYSEYCERLSILINHHTHLKLCFI